MLKSRKEQLFTWLFGFFFWWFLLIPFEYSLFATIVEAIQLPFYSLLRLFDKTIQFESDTFGMFALIGISGILASLSFPLIVKFIARLKITSSELLSSFLVGILVLFLMKYGYIKLIKTQFYLPEPNIVYSSFGKLSKDIAYWSIIGSSDIYNRISGLVEISCAFLLYFRKTRFLGSLLACFIFGNVLLINISFDISVKLFSFSLFVASFLVLILHPKFTLLFKNEQSEVRNSEKVVSNKIKLIFLLLVSFECLTPSLKRIFYQEKNPIEKYVGAYEIENHPNLKRFFVNSQNYFIFQTKNNEMMDWNVLSFENNKWVIQKGNIEMNLIWKKHHLIFNNQKLTFKRIDYKNLPLLQDKVHLFADEYH